MGTLNCQADMYAPYDRRVILPHWRWIPAFAEMTGCAANCCSLDAGGAVYRQSLTRPACALYQHPCRQSLTPPACAPDLHPFKSYPLDKLSVFRR